MGKHYQLVQFLLAVCAYFLSLLKYLQVNEVRVYNSDLLYIPTLFKDITAWGGSMSDWHLTPAPYFFPDMALYFPLAYMIENWHIVLLSFSIIQITLFTLGWCLIGKSLFKKMQPWSYMSLVLLVVAVLLTSSNTIHTHALKPQFQISNHFGVMLCLPYILFFSLNIIDRNRNYFFLFAFLASITLVNISDAISFPQLIIPLLVAVAYLWLIRAISYRKGLSIAALLALGVLASQLLYQLLIQHPVRSTSFQISTIAKNMGNSLTEITQTAINLWQNEHQTTFLFLSIALIVHIALCLAAIRYSVKRDHINRGLLFISAFWLFSLVLTIVSVVGTGLFVDALSLRYLYPATILPLYSLVPITYIVLQKLQINNLIIFPLSIFLILTQINSFVPLNQLNKYSDHYPPLIACIDSVTTERGVRAGIGGYWDAKYISVLSKQGINISQVSPNFDPYIWINNPTWYKRYPPQFVIFDPNSNDKLDMGFIINRFGYPEEIVQCETRELWFYDRPYDEPFQNYFLDHPILDLNTQGK